MRNTAIKASRLLQQQGRTAGDSKSSPIPGISSYHHIKSVTANGDSMDPFLVYPITMRSVTANGDSMDQFLVFPITMRSDTAMVLA